MSSLCPPVTAVSSIVRSTVKLKSEEVANAKAALELRYNEPYPAELASDTRARLTALLERVKKLDPYLEQEDDLTILSRYVEQARDDQSITEEKLLKLEKDLNSKLLRYAARLEVSSLHVELLEKELDKDEVDTSLATNLGNATIDDDFEMVEGGPEDAVEKFEQHAFTNKHVDTKAIEEYLGSFFNNDRAQAQLEGLRLNLGIYGEGIISGQEKLEEELVTWCITDLLKNALLSDATRIQLQEYLENPIALREMTSTLNMKSVRHWNWRCGDKGLPVTARQNAEGKYCIAVDEDILDLLFLHTIAVGWSMKLKSCLRDKANLKCIWPGNESLTMNEAEKREYYLHSSRIPPASSCYTCHGPPPMPPQMYCPPPPMYNMPHVYTPAPRPMRRQAAALPPPPPPVAVSPPPPMPVQRIPPKSKRVPPGPPRHGCAPPPPPPPGSSCLNDERFRNYSRDFFLSRLPKLEGCAPEVVAPETTQAVLIKTLAAELKVREAFDGSAHALTADFDSFASSLPHDTILTVLKFLGIPERWLDFFKRFLAAPLNMGPVVRGTSDQVLTRACGIPIAHGFEPLITEALLFFLDLTAHQKTGGYMYRLRDRCYFVGKETQCAALRNELNTFASTMGLKVHINDRLDTTPIGFMRFSTPKDGRVSFILDNPTIDAYARRLKKQLAAAPTVHSWITTWNTTIGTYAEHLFGPLASIFGAAHLDAVIQAHNRIHAILFPGSNLTAHIKTLLTTHLRQPLSNAPFRGEPLIDLPCALEPLIYLPLAYGGLGVKNPYTTLNLTRGCQDVLGDPDADLRAYLQSERTYYEAAKAMFERMRPEERAWKQKAIFRGDAEHMARVLGADVDANKFFSFEEFAAHRERVMLPFLPPPMPPATYTPTPSALSSYIALLTTRAPLLPLVSDRVYDEIARLSGKLDMPRFNRLEPEERWVLQLYGDECFERYGGLEVWHGDSVPREVVRAVRGERLDRDEDEDSVSSGYSD